MSETGGINVTVDNGIRTIFLNRPQKKNSLSPEGFIAVGKALEEANNDENTKIIVITGAGDFFCSGNDLSNFMNVTDPEKEVVRARDMLEKHVAAYIDCRKPLIAIVNGPAIGIAATVLGLCDAVYCSDLAYFRTPFSALGQTPEGCSSYTFPKLMGYAKASEMLYFNQQITAAEAERCGLVSKIYPHSELRNEAWRKIKDIAELPIKSLMFTKELVRGPERETLHKVNKAECDRLFERWQSEDCMEAVMKFFQMKSKF